MLGTTQHFPGAEAMRMLKASSRMRTVLVHRTPLL